MIPPAPVRGGRGSAGGIIPPLLERAAVFLNRKRTQVFPRPGKVAANGKDYFFAFRRLEPVMAAGFSTPISSSRVGAMSARMPSSNR